MLAGRLVDEEVETLRSQPGQVLEYSDILQQVDTSAVDPTAQVLSSWQRDTPDTPDRHSQRQVLANAPA